MFFLNWSSRFFWERSLIYYILFNFNESFAISADIFCSASLTEGKFDIFFYRYESFIAKSYYKAAFEVFILWLSWPMAPYNSLIFSEAFLSTSRTNSLR